MTPQYRRPPTVIRNARRTTNPVPAKFAVLLLLVIVTAFAGLPYLIASEDAQRPLTESQIRSLQLPPGVALGDLREAQVLEVIDGDTIDVNLDGKFARIRYFGVDTPERGDRCFREATDRNQTLAPVGGRILLLPDARDSDTFGRLLRYVFLADGTSIDATLVAEGLGSAWREDGRYRDTILPMEDEARTADRGCLWK